MKAFRFKVGLSESIDKEIERRQKNIVDLKKKLELAEVKEEEKELERKIFRKTTLGRLMGKVKR